MKGHSLLGGFLLVKNMITHSDIKLIFDRESYTLYNAPYMSKRIFNLIKAMSKREKILFSTKHGNKSSTYFKVYKIYDQFKEYDKEKIDAKLAKNLKGKDTRQASSYLEKEIVKILSDHLERPKILSDIKILEDQMDLYISKGLVQDIFKVQKKLCDKYNASFQYAKEIDLSFAWIYSHFIHNESNIDIKVNTRLAKIDELKILSNEEILSKKIYSTSILRGTKSLKLLPGESAEEIQIKLNEIYDAINKFNNPIALLFLREAEFIYLNILEDIDGCFKSCQSFLDICHTYPMLKEVQVSRYSQKCLHVLMLAALKKDIDPLIIQIKENLDGINSTLFSVELTKALSNIFYLKIKLTEFGLEKSLQLKQEYESYIIDKNLLTHTYINAAFFNILTHLNFILGDYEKCIDWINQFESNVDKNARTDLRANVKLINAMCHYMLNNDLLLPYAFKQAYRYFSKNVELNPFEQWSFKSLQKIHHKGFSKKLLAELIEEYKLFEASEDYNYSREFDYGLWFRSQLEDTSYFSLLIAEKALVPKPAN